MTVIIRGTESEKEKEPEFFNPYVKFHSQTSIAIAALIGGPVAACFLMMRNFFNLDRIIAGWLAVILGIATEAALYYVIPTLPTSYFENVPILFLWLIDTLIIMMIVKASMGGDLDQHKEYKGDFYSRWNAVGIGVVCAIITALLYINIPHPSAEAKLYYDERITIFKENERKALRLFWIAEEETTTTVPWFASNTAIPKWEANLELVESFEAIIGDLPSEEAATVPLLRDYCEKRIEEAQLYAKSIEENTTDYDNKIESLRLEINNLLEQLSW